MRRGPAHTVAGLLVVAFGALTVACSAAAPTVRPADPSGSPRVSTSPTIGGQATGRASTRPADPTTDPRPTREPRPNPDPAPTREPRPGETPLPSQEPSPSDDARELPACRYRDLPTRHAGQEDWAITLVDTIYRLPADFVPDRLVSTARAGLQAGYEIRPEVVDDLRAMALAAEADGAPIAVRWAYRSYGEQAGAFAYWERLRGREAALRISARPGHSEHQLGTAVDFRSADSLKPPWDYEDWGTTPAGRWMARESWRYGFILSFPRGMEEETCYSYEPWHFRYMGRDLARSIHESGVSIRRYLWEHFHGAGDPGAR